MKEKILAEIARLKERYAAFHRRDGIDWPLDNYGKMRAYKEIEDFINSLPEEPVSEDICNQCEAHNDKDKCDELVFGHKCPIVTTSEDLEEASEEYTGKVLERTNMLIGNQPVGEEIEAAFKAGAQWQQNKQKEQYDLIQYWFEHIAQIADDRMTATGQRMTDSHALDEIKAIAKDSVYYIKNHVEL